MMHVHAMALSALLTALPFDRRASVVPDAVVDLRTQAGVELVGGPWRFRSAELAEVQHRAAGADHLPSGSPLSTHDLVPKAGARDFDDAAWETLAPESLEGRRGSGRLSFAWYRLRLVLPEKLGDVDVAGTSLVFEVVVDDYAEVWVDGRLPLALGQQGAGAVAGWNAPTRLVLTRDARPGMSIQLAVLAANAPLSDPPPNYVWLRSATLDVYRAGKLDPPEAMAFTVRSREPGLEAVVPGGVRLERLASGFLFGEGPAWSPDGALLFSDPNANVVHRWHPDQGVSIYRTKSGYSGLDIGRYRQSGSNGLAFDSQGRLTLCEHGNRRVTRLEKNGTLTVLASHFEGRRLNSPNDLVYRSDGALYFTDPPFGLPGFHGDPARELDFTGVFCLKDGVLRAVSRELQGPNGLAFSPDERFLYVANWDPARKVVMRHAVAADGSLAPGEVLCDMGSAPEEEALDGIEVDARGNLFVSGPGGLWVLDDRGRHLGTLVLPELPANMEFGGADGRELYLTARTGLYRLVWPCGPSVLPASAPKQG
jgi:gluconolactonase